MYNQFENSVKEMNYIYPEHIQFHVDGMYNKCVELIQKKVRIVTVDQKVYEGVIQHVDKNNVYVIPYGANNNSRLYPPIGYGFPGFGYPGFGYGYPGYGYGYPGYGPGLGGLILPLFGLAALSAI